MKGQAGGAEVTAKVIKVNEFTKGKSIQEKRKISRAKLLLLLPLGARRMICLG